MRRFPGQNISAQMAHHFAILLALALIATVMEISIGRLALPWFGAAFAALFILQSQPTQASPTPSRRLPPPLLVAWTGYALILLAISLAHRTPLGYDYGFYKVAYDQFVTGEFSNWAAQQFPAPTLAMYGGIAHITGVSSQAVLRVTYPLLSVSVGLVGTLLVATRSGSRAAWFASAVWWLLAPILAAFMYLYLKQWLALGLLLASILFLENRRWPLAGISLVAVAVLHRPTAIVAAIAMLTWSASALRHQENRRAILWTGAATLAGTLALWAIFAESYIQTATRVAIEAGATFSTPTAGAGSFMPLPIFLAAAVPVLTLAVAAMATRSGRIFAVLTIFCGTYAAVGLPLATRFLVPAAIFGALAAGTWFAAAWDWDKRKAVIIAGLTLVVLAPATIAMALEIPTQHRPLAEDHWAGITWLALEAPHGGSVIADQQIAPYIFAEVGASVYAPGLFDDPHNYREWQAMFATQNSSVASEFLAPYPAPTYIYHAKELGPGLGTAKFDGTEFVVVFEDEWSKIWRHVGERND